MESATPLNHWIGFHVYIFALLAMELLYARRPTRLPTGGETARIVAQKKTRRTSIVASVLWITAALLFAYFIFRTYGSASAGQYLAGYAIEEALSVDNLFVFLILFRVFKIAPSRQPRVLFWGVAGAIVMRGGFIAAGVGLLQHFHWISYAFGVLLFAASIRLLFTNPGEPNHATPRWCVWLSKVHPVSMRDDRFFTVEHGQRVVTMMFLCLIAIEITDIIFALDSIPAVLSITRDPFLAYSSNIMAVMGLRSLYFLLASLLTKLRFLHYGLAVILLFAAIKMLAAGWIEIGPLVSLAVIFALLSVTVAASLIVSGPKETAAS